MSTIYIAEGNFIGGGGNHPVQGMFVPPITEQTVTIGGGSASSNPFSKNTTVVRINTDAVCSIAFGVSPIANTSNMRLAANQTEYFTVIPGQLVAVISNV